MKKLVCLVIVGLVILTSARAPAAVIDWTDWTTRSLGNPGSASGTTPTYGVGVSYSGEVEIQTNIIGTYPSYTPATTYADGVIVQNAPSPRDIIALYGGPTTGTNTITFSEAVTDPIMTIWSLGSPTILAQFVFLDTEPFAIIDGGPSAEYGGSSITSVGNTVYGREGNGTIRFDGTFSSLSWTNPLREVWYGFDVGITRVSDVPEPSTFLLLGAGLAGVGLLRRRVK